MFYRDIYFIILTLVGVLTVFLEKNNDKKGKVIAVLIFIGSVILNFLNNV